MSTGNKQSGLIFDPLSRFLIRIRISILWMQIFTLLLLIGSATLALQTNIHFLYAGTLFCLAMFVDVLTHRLADNIYTLSYARGLVSVLIRYTGYAAFFLATGVNAYLLSDNHAYILFVLFSFFLWGYLTLLMAKYASSETGELSNLLDVPGLDYFHENNPQWWDRLLLLVYKLVHTWLFPLIVLLASIAGRSGHLFLASTIVLIFVIIFLLRLLGRHDTGTARAVSRSGISFLFYMFGVSILLLLIARLPFSDVLEAIQVVGPEVIWLLFLPAIWVIPYAMTIRVLLDYRVTVRDALYTQISGDAFNSITPLLGMGGEPYKAKHLSRFVPLEDSSRAIVQSRLIHALSGVLFTGVVLLITVFVADLSRLPGLSFALSIVSLIMFTVSGLLLWVTMSRVPSKLTGLILSKFKIIEDFRHDRLPWSTLIIAMSYKIGGRIGKFLELYVIFIVLGIMPGFADVVLVEAMIMASVSLFFFIPQGLGVNEAGIVTAFTVAGYAAATGVAFGLIRRARMVVYALFGLVVYLVGTLTGYGKSRYRTNTTSLDS